MKNFLMLFGAIFILLTADSPAQTGNFDSVYTLASSPDYNYKNALFESNKNSGPSSISSWVVYERHRSNGASDVIIRKASYTGYTAETIVTSSTTELNINPVVSGNFLIWQTNKLGNWDLMYSIYNGSTWTIPQYYSGNTLQNEEQPSMHYLTDFALIAFKRNNDIFLGKYISATQQWETPEVNATDTISAPCSYPLIVSQGSPLTLAFFKMTTDIDANLRIRNFNATAAPGYNWHSAYDVNLPVIPFRLTVSYGNDYSAYILINNNNTVNGVSAWYGTLYSNLTPNIAGEKRQGKGVYMPFITNSPAPTYFSSFGCITKRNDSTFASLCRRYIVSNSGNQIRQKYIGNGSVTTAFDISNPLFSGVVYRMRALWEQNINGKTAIMESWAQDAINEIISQEDLTSYNLSQNYPNPFNPSTRINYELKITNFVSLKVFDLLGKEVATLVNEKQNAGSYAVDFNSAEYNLPSGIYFYTLSAGEFKETRKMILIK